MAISESITSKSAISNRNAESSFSQRIELILNQQKRNKVWLAEKIGISKQAMNYILNKSGKPKYIMEIADALGVNPEWLASGQGCFTIQFNNQYGVRQIPLFDLSNFMEANPKNLETAEQVSIDPSYPPECFAIQLDNTSMEPYFNQNSILIFDPSRQAKNGDYVIFSLENSNKSLFRQYFSDGSDTYLKAIDPMYNSIKNKNIIIQGILIESRNHFK